MMSAQQMNRMADDACRRSRAEGILPIAFTAEELADDAKLVAHIRRIPFIGSRRPRGFKLLKASDYGIRVTVPVYGPEAGTYVQVDSSGFGDEGEFALTLSQFCEAVRKVGPGKCFATVEAGQFQAVIAIFQRRQA